MRAPRNGYALVMDDTVVDVPSRGEARAPLRFGQRYRALALLGSGGEGSVYLVHDEELGELVALKLLRPDLGGDPRMLERMREEVRLARLISSPFVARTHDIAEHEGRWFVTMQYVEGETLSARLRRERRLPLDEAVRVARDVCEGLAAVHAAGVVHRDLKPANVLLAKNGRALIADFGIALRAESLGAATDRSGTPAYAAPEQVAGRAIDARTDVFAAGGLLYMMTTGLRPFSNERTGDEPSPDPRAVAPDLPDRFAGVVRRAMAFDPDDRYPSANALGGALAALRVGAARAQVGVVQRFVRSLHAEQARTMTLPPLETESIDAELARATSDELVAKLRTRGRVRVVADEARAEAVLRGRVARHADGYALHLVLRSRDDGWVFWAETVAAPEGGLQTLVERAALAIERAFAPTIEPIRESDGLPSAEVERLVVEARAEYRRSWRGGVQRSVELFERASALAPDHPLVVAWMASAATLLAFFDDTPGVLERARSVAKRAVELAPDVAETRDALASAHLLDMRVAEAAPQCVAAVRLAPGDVEQRTYLARLLGELGADGPALDLAASTFALDPTFEDPLAVPARHWALRGRLDLVDAELARGAGEPARPAQLFLVRCCLWYRDAARLRELERRFANAELDPAPRAMLAMTQRLFAGETDVAAMLPPPFARAARRRSLAAQIAAEAYAFVGDAPGALAALEQSSELGAFDVPWIDRCPLFDPLRGVVRFELVRRAIHERALEALTAIEHALEA